MHASYSKKGRAFFLSILLGITMIGCAGRMENPMQNSKNTDAFDTEVNIIATTPTSIESEDGFCTALCDGNYGVTGLLVQASVVSNSEAPQYFACNLLSDRNADHVPWDGFVRCYHDMQIREEYTSIGQFDTMDDRENNPALDGWESQVIVMNEGKERASGKMRKQ